VAVNVTRLPKLAVPGRKVSVTVGVIKPATTWVTVLGPSAHYSYDVSVTERLSRVCQVVSIGLGDQIEGLYAGTRVPPGRLRSKQGNENPDEDSDSGQKRRVSANY
jgi:hypothetical protein